MCNANMIYIAESFGVNFITGCAIEEKILEQSCAMDSGINVTIYNQINNKEQNVVSAQQLYVHLV